MQETNILEGAFEHCPFIVNNFQIIAQNNETGFGVCSLVSKRLSISDEYIHPSGRLIAFNIGPVTMVNTYLPSGSDFNAKNKREDFCGQIIPNMLINAKKSGLCGGDWNSTTHAIDSSNHTEAKLSPNLKKLITLYKWKDTYRLLHPNTVSYSHFYNRNMSGKGLTHGGSRLDRSYQWGEVKTSSAEYIGVSFSDHLLHLVRVECPAPMKETEVQVKPYFKISPDIARDEDFKSKVDQITKEWEKAKDKVPLFLWWDELKRDIRRAAKEFKKAKAREKKANLTFLMLAQVHLSRKASNGDLTLLPKLKAIQLQINEWFDKQAEKVKLHARLQDIQESEKIRIYHHEQLYRTINKSSILKLKTPNGLISGHKDCANHLNEEVIALLGEEAKLDTTAQDKLLEDVTEVFTAKDNEMLDAEITDAEVKESLRRSNKSAAPGCDSITFLVYEQCWGSLGPHLCQVIRQVVQSGVPTESMRYAFQVFSPKPGKVNSLLSRDKRRLALLQSDHKILTGILAARLRKTEDHTLSAHQYAAGPRRITHAISQARDAIQSVSPNQKGLGLIETDFMIAYDLLAVSWTWRVLQRKGCSPDFISTLRSIYETTPNYVINIINNEQQEKILNKRKNIKQGDRTSTTLFCFSVDPLLVHLDKRLQGYVYHKLPTQGPKHPSLGPPSPVEARLKVFGFVDDVKGVISSMAEFKVLDDALRLFELASGSRLHRDPTTKKCQILTLGKWARWTQNESPLNYMAIVDQLNFLGVKLARTSTKTRATNGDDLTKKIKSTIGAYKAGRHSALICRPHTTNCYVSSKINYRSSVINLRAQDIQGIQSAVKQWICQNLLLRPPESLLFRELEQGGLGLVNTGARCQANLIKTFIQQSHPGSKFLNNYLNTLYRCYVTGELDEGTIKRPPYYSLDFFRIIKEVAEEENENILHITTKGWQRRLLERGITHTRDPVTKLPELILTDQEKRLSQADWYNAWSIRRRQGLTPAQKSWLFLWANGLVINNERLHKLGKIPLPTCDFCGEMDNRCHILNCPFNKNISQGIKKVINTCTEFSANESDIDILDLKIPTNLQLPALFTFSEVLQLLQESRTNKKCLNLKNVTADILSKSEAFLLSKKMSFAHTIVKMWMESFFTEEPEASSVSSSASSSSQPAVRRPAHPNTSEHQAHGVGNNPGYVNTPPVTKFNSFTKGAKQLSASQTSRAVSAVRASEPRGAGSPSSAVPHPSSTDHVQGIASRSADALFLRGTTGRGKVGRHPQHILGSLGHSNPRHRRPDSGLVLPQQEEAVLPEPAGREPGVPAAHAADDGPSGPSSSPAPADALCASCQHASHGPTSRRGEPTGHGQSSTGCSTSDNQAAALEGACSRRQPASHHCCKGE